jgi:Bacterial Ig-like domain
LKRVVLVAIFAVAACNQGSPDEGLARAVDHGGPKVAFDLLAQPVPQIPFPNDLAATPDKNSPTGVRLNSSIAAPTLLESQQRGLIDTLDGFGTFAPITVAFDRDIDAASLQALQNDADPTNDGVYLVNLLTGVLAPIDVGGGHFPITLSNPSEYFVNDPSANVFNLLFPLTNSLSPLLPNATVRQQADSVLSFYELSTHTLIIRPVVPLAQDTRYAVVLTNRIHDANGNAISSPHVGINHSSQTTELQPLLSHLPAGVQLSDIAYTWAFTTQSISRQLELLRLGLTQGSGPFGSLDLTYRISGANTATTNASAIIVLQERGSVNPSNDPTDYILPVNDCTRGCFKTLLEDPDIGSLFSGTSDPAALQALEASLQYVDYLATAAYPSPDLLFNDSGNPRDQSFQLDEISNTVRATAFELPFLIAVPKEMPAVGHLAPFPLVIAGHDFGGSRNQEVVSFGGTFAKFGLATVAIDAYGQGISVDPALEVLARSIMTQDGVGPFADLFFSGRSVDLNFDGARDPGGDFWTFDSFHTRDAIRQTLIDEMQLVRVLRTFDGTTRMTLGDLPLAFAGDFNNDGIPDLGGAHVFPNTVFAADGVTQLFEKGAVNPGADIFSFGVSLGGVLSSILPAVEPEVFAGAEVSGAGGLMDVSVRSSSSTIVNGVFLEALGPFFATCPFSATSGPVDPQTTLHLGGCNPAAADAVPSLVMVVQEVNHERDIPIQPLVLAPGDRLMVQDLAQGNGAGCGVVAAAGCNIGTADASGNVRVAFGADQPVLAGTEVAQPPGFLETVSVTELSPGDSLTVTILPAAGTAPTVVASFGKAFTFSGIAYGAGDPLTAVSRGLGLTRNTPAFRRMIQLSQLILEAADPANYVNHYAQDSILVTRGTADTVSGFVGGPASLLAVTTTGDTIVPASTGFSLARAAGLIELSTPDPAYGLTDDQVLIRGGVVEGIAATDRFDDADGGVFAALPGQVQCDPAAAQPCSGDVLLDPGGYSCTGATCTDGLGAPRLVPPLRTQLTRAATPAGACPVSARSTVGGCWSGGASACAAGVPGLSALLIPYSSRTGSHGISGPQPGKAFDTDQFIANAIGRYFECRGGEVHFDACQTDLASCPWIPQPPPPATP